MGLRRWLRTAAALAVLAVAVAAAVFPAIYVVSVFVGVFVDPIESAGREISSPLMLGSIVASVACAWAGSWLMRGRRDLVIFLRRFGHQGAASTVSAAARRIGGSWRMFTLDDARVAPVGVGAVAAGVRAFGGVLGFIVDLRIPALSRLWERTAAPRRFLIKWSLIVGFGCALTAQAINWLRTGNFEAEPEHGGVELVLFWAGGVALLPAIIVGVIFAVGYMVVIFTVPVVWLVDALVDAVYAADDTRAIEVPDRESVEPLRQTLLQQSRRVFSPRLAVLKVASDVWQHAVAEFAAISTVLLIDVSEPTSNLVWEVRMGVGQHRCVFVCQQDAIGRLADVPELLDLLDGQTVLCYTTDRRGVRRFTRSLRGLLWATAASPSAAPSLRP